VVLLKRWSGRNSRDVMLHALTVKNATEIWWLAARIASGIPCRRIVHC
jgi:hypothetical protein